MPDHARPALTVGDIEVTAELNGSATARLIQGILPVESTASLRGDELYFSIPLDAEEEDPQAKVPFGTVAYWPPGKALCLFFGQQPYSPVNIVGHLRVDPKVLANARDGDAVAVRAI